MAQSRGRIRPLRIPNVGGNYFLALLAVVALAAALGFWYWSAKDTIPRLSLGTGVELKYRKELVGVLCEEAAARELRIEVQPNGRAAEAIDRVNRGELDATVIPAGLAVPGPNLRQVAMLECEALHLFVKPGLLAQGVAGLKGKRVNVGPSGSGVRIIAGEVLQFIGMKAGEDYLETSYSFTELFALPPAAMPDAVFGLSPLPSPMGEKLVQQYGYGLMELPFAEALALRKPYIEDATVPADTYGVHPAVPEKPLHTVGTRAVLVAHRDVSKLAIRRLLEVLYESDFARRVGMRPLDVSLTERSGEYPNHAGTAAYLHRHDPWISKEIIERAKGVLATIASAISGFVLAWQWYGRRVGRIDAYLRECNRVELDALRAYSRGEFGESELNACIAQLTQLRMEILEKHQAGIFAGDQQLLEILARMESLQQTLPGLLRSGATEPVSVSLPAPPRKAG